MSVAPRHVLVKCGDSQKPIRLEPPWTKPALLTIVQDKFSLPSSVPILLQIYDQDWKTYIDLEDDLDIPDRSKVSVIVRPVVYNHDTTCQQRPINSGSVDTYSQIAGDDAQMSSCSQRLLPSNVESSMTETSVRLPQQRYEGVQSEPLVGNKRNVVNEGRYNRPDDSSFCIQPSFGETGGQSSGYSREAVSSGQNFQPGRNDAQATLQAAGQAQPTKSVFIELAEEELLALSEEDESLPDDLDSLTEVHFQSNWPIPYSLSNDIFPQRLTRALENQEQLDWSLRHILVQGITDSILSYTTYPSQKQKKDVISALFERYPYLDHEGPNSFKRWHHVLTEKFKNVRRKMTTPEVVRRKRKRVGSGESSPNNTVNEDVDGNEDSLEMSVYDEDVSYHRPESSNMTPHVSNDVTNLADDISDQYPQSRQNIPISRTSQEPQPYTRLDTISQFEKTFQTNSQSWPKPYVLPKRLFPPILLNALQCKSKLDSPKANLLIRCLSDSIQTYNIFPSVKQREEMVKCLIREYPHLRDNSPTGWTNYYIKLSERFKNIRRKLMKGKRESDMAFFAPEDSVDSSDVSSVSDVLDANSIKIEIP